MVQPYSWFKAAAIFMLSLDYLTAQASAGDATEKSDEIDVKYALLGAGIGLFLVISFVLIKVYMIKKHIFENEFSDPPSRQSNTLREWMREDRKRSELSFRK
ncbi:transmembrane protein 273 [Callorhinchus milii]|uniref:transmembrane protein 273 n=1 Tax=Callorhinchus milii TaxID=7868 RepID=UPI0004574724|nr:transmembrane protein 273 [Callorhinchus milii]|eukprot:gi/632972655/ref/XP_007902766.1/ PREDICTED: putative uncharacterized protein C10orf128 homolog [Callorhinchus milii]